MSLIDDLVIWQRVGMSIVDQVKIVVINGDPMATPDKNLHHDA